MNLRLKISDDRVSVYFSTGGSCITVFSVENKATMEDIDWEEVKKKAETALKELAESA